MDTRTVSSEWVNKVVQEHLGADWFDCEKTDLFDHGQLDLTVSPRVDKIHEDFVKTIRGRFCTHITNALLNELCKRGIVQSGNYIIKQEDI